MITKLQTIFLKHNKVLFSILLVVVLVTFVLTIGPQSFFGGPDPMKVEARNFFGYNLNNENNVRSMMVDAQVSAAFHPELGLRGDSLGEYAYMRVAALGLARQLGLPRPTRDQVDAYVRSLDAFSNPQTGAFDAEAYRATVSMLKDRAGFSDEQMSRVLRDDTLINTVRTSLGGPAYIVPFEIRQDYLARETSWEVDIATFDYNSFQPQLDPTVEQLEAFYDSNPERYAEPEKIRVAVVRFDAASFIDQIAAPAEDVLAGYFERNRFRYQRLFDDRRKAAADAAAAALGTEAPAAEPEAQTVTLADVRSDVENDWRRDQARGLAGERAERFSLALWENKIERGSEAFDQQLAQSGGTLVPVPAYTRGSSPAPSVLPNALAETMWVHAESVRYFSDPVETPDGAAVAIFQERIAARQPAFTEVNARVEQDWKAEERRRLFIERGAELRAELEAAVAAGTSFADAATGLGLAVESPEPFKGSDVPVELLRNQAWAQAQYTAPGGITPMVASATEGVFVHVRSKTVPEISDDSPELAQFMENRRGIMDRMSGWLRLQEFTTRALESLDPQAANQASTAE